MAAYLEHMAFRVNDLDWCVDFFQDVFDMPVRLTLGEKPHRKIWLHAGIQMNEDLEYDNQLPMADNWLKMPNGNVIELNPGEKQELDTILNAKPWIE